MSKKAIYPPMVIYGLFLKGREVLDEESGILDIPEEPVLTAKKGQRRRHTRKVCIRGTDGETKYLLGISEEITERKKLEGALHKAHETLEQALWKDSAAEILGLDRSPLRARMRKPGIQKP